MSEIGLPTQLKEGKNKFTIFNAMKNKLVRLIFSLAKQSKKYDENYTYSIVWIIEIPMRLQTLSLYGVRSIPTEDCEQLRAKAALWEAKKKRLWHLPSGPISMD